jgi:hypothetical protein
MLGMSPVSLMFPWFFCFPAHSGYSIYLRDNMPFHIPGAKKDSHPQNLNPELINHKYKSSKQ